MHFSEDGSSDSDPPNSWKIQTKIINNYFFPFISVVNLNNKNLSV